MTNRNRLQPHETYAVLARYGHTGSSLAAALGVNQATVSRWVTRGVPLDQLARVCAVLGCRPDKLRPECVDVDGNGVWMVPAAAILGDVSKTAWPRRARIVLWSDEIVLRQQLGEPIEWVPLDKLAG